MCPADTHRRWTDPVRDAFQYEAVVLSPHLWVLLEVGPHVILDLPPLPCPQLGTHVSTSIAPGTQFAVPLPSVALDSLQGAGWKAL